eukprot:CAMPEP_0177678600 /NCGR_PEP_ID=MMETSP0447-20121125/29097_1 /TAXON_ID=0 /ORGANISM="Stygamoeba regulata, Strain BSH-02190019" /LENGTH=147 /DNA_ID=CAMNT_0019187617 /DNA_START=133 /DNA_END=573 /DNA_ORIENTATION=-
MNPTEPKTPSSTPPSTSDMGKRKRRSTLLASIHDVPIYRRSQFEHVASPHPGNRPSQRPRNKQKQHCVGCQRTHESSFFKSMPIDPERRESLDPEVAERTRRQLEAAKQEQRRAAVNAQLVADLAAEHKARWVSVLLSAKNRIACVS